MLALSLRQGGYQVTTAGDGREALAALALEPFEWLITDCRMFPMNGFELARKALELRPGIGIVMISAAHSAQDAEGLPIAGFIPKPVALERLFKTLAPRP